MSSLYLRVCVCVCLPTPSTQELQRARVCAGVINCAATTSSVIHIFYLKVTEWWTRADKQALKKQTLGKLLNTFPVFTLNIDLKKHWKDKTVLLFFSFFRGGMYSRSIGVSNQLCVPSVECQKWQSFKNKTGTHKKEETREWKSLMLTLCRLFFLIPLSVCMSDRDQRWRNVT